MINKNQAIGQLNKIVEDLEDTNLSREEYFDAVDAAKTLESYIILSSTKKDK